MKKKQTLDKTETPKKGLELDKIDLANLFEVKDDEQDDSEAKDIGPAKPPGPHGSSQKFQAVIVVFLVIALLAGLYFFWKENIFNLDFFKKTGGQDLTGYYLNLGPVLTGHEKGKYLRINLDIKCATPEAKDRLSRMKNALKGRILVSLSAPGVDRMIANRNYEELRKYLKGRLNNMLKDDSIEEVYFSNILLY